MAASSTPYTESEPELSLSLNKLKLELPAYGPALAPGVTVQESDQPAITDDRLAPRPFQRLIRLVRRSTTVPF